MGKIYGGKAGLNHDGTDLWLASDGPVKIGEAANHMEIKPDGEINLAGTARVERYFRTPAPSWTLGVSAPSAGLVGVVPTVDFDATSDDEAHYSAIVPFTFAAETDVEVGVCWCYTGAGDVGTVCWAIEYILVAAGEAVAGATATISQCSAGNHTSGQRICTTFTSKITGAVESDLLGMRFYRDTSEDTLATDARVIQVHLRYTMDKLGKAT